MTASWRRTRLRFRHSRTRERIASMTASVEPGRFRDCRRRWWTLLVQTRLKISTGRQLSCFGKRPEHAFDQRRVAIFLDLPDLAVLDSEHQAIVVVVALAGLRNVVAPRLNRDVIAVGDEVERKRARPLGEERAEMAHQAVLDRLAPPELMRPGILPGHDPARILGKIVGECRAAAVGGIGEDLLH